MSPRTMPNASSMALAIGAKQLVVHEALEIILSVAGSYLSSFTPMTIVMSSPLAGAEMITFLAPAVMCFPADCASVKIPVDSTTISAPIFPHGRSAGSRSAKIGIRTPLTTIAPSSATTVPLNRPKLLSYFNKCARVLVSVRSLIPTTCTSAPLTSIARKKLRPMRPNPLIRTFTEYSSICVYDDAELLCPAVRMNVF